eukprot:CAMPEP_0172716604 /NCGR_PEP_ID=MMETSP1074-20121228/68930_1 /TAXON_ID=2916 /ORGANISM="Ceratium fusus, Strain PA161109" /LENGTH=54 /DNA_ID=CAMNT_0013541349 /DNA_START=75 /DNA_END=236 /DNA_ORIENTATION=+
MGTNVMPAARFEAVSPPSTSAASLSSNLRFWTSNRSVAAIIAVNKGEVRAPGCA